MEGCEEQAPDTISIFDQIYEYVGCIKAVFRKDEWVVF